MGLMDQPSYHTPKEQPREVTWSAPRPPTFIERLLQIYNSAKGFVKKNPLKITLALLTIIILRAVYLSATQPNSVFKVVNPNRPTASPAHNLPSPVPISPTLSQSPALKQVDNQLGGYRFQYPETLEVKSDSSYYAAFHPTLYDPTHYFDCINSQLGRVITLPCWLLEVQITLDDSPEISSNPAENQTYTDTQNRVWSITGPSIDSDYSLLQATLKTGDISYRFDTRAPLESLKNFIRSDSPTPTKDVLTQAHLNLAGQMLSSFVIYRKPILQEPTWIFKQLDAHWQISHPQNWQVFQTGGEINLPQGSYRLIGEYGIYPSASFHDYSLQLDTISSGNLPESARASLTAWVDYELSLLNSDERSRTVLSDVVVAGHPAKKVLNLPEITYQYGLPRLKRGAITHKVYIWNSSDTSLRTVTIQQLDRSPNLMRLENLLDLFISKILS